MKIITTTTYKVEPEKGPMSFEDRCREALAFVDAYKALYSTDEKGYRLYSRSAFLDFCEKVEDVLNDRVH